ncbi:MAG TPA: SemiSWEET family transporter, partial [Bacteroidales bacterium]|nr:SemiSWEET family transporter [Bacteroidales bacterium]
AAAFFGTILMLPQTYKSYKTKKVNDISMSMLVVYIINCALWEVYGWLLHSDPIIVCNLIALVIGMIQIGIKLKYRNRELEV